MSEPDDYAGPAVWQMDRHTGRLIARERRYKGAAFFDLRLWAGDGDKPTAKGITIPIDAVAGLADALAAYAAARASQAD